MPTEKSPVVRNGRDIDVERQRLLGWTNRFAAGGPEKCTPMEWATMAYQHMDHHLRQFGVSCGE